jgi:membrane fusion protein (multidrug efflux system)
MKFPGRGVLITVAIICLSIGGYLIYRGEAQKTNTASPVSEDAGSAASVRVAPIKAKTISTAIMAFGDVVPAPGAVQVASMPYEIRVNRIMVSTGQKISRGEPLLEVEPSPDTVLQLQQAQNSYEISKQSLDHVKQLFDLKLATNAQILKAQEVFQQASLQLESLKKMGVDEKRVIRATESGLISYVNVQEGAIVADGKPLVGIIAQNRLEVRLGVEPNNAERLISGQTVTLAYVNEPSKKEVAGKVRKISRAVNTTSRLVDVFVSLPSSCGFLLGEYIKGRIEMASSYGMVVPRSAVLPEGDGHVLFTVSNGHAIRHIVKVLLENDKEVQVSSDGLNQGDMAVVEGNYELKDGMAVRILRAR